MPSIQLNTEEVAPIPKVRQRIDRMEKPGLRQFRADLRALFPVRSGVADLVFDLPTEQPPGRVYFFNFQQRRLQRRLIVGRHPARLRNREADLDGRLCGANETA